MFQSRALAVMGLHLYVAQCKGIELCSRATEVIVQADGCNNRRCNSAGMGWSYEMKDGGKPF